MASEAPQRNAAEHLQELQQQIAEQVQQLVDGEQWQGWLSVAARFHTYSLNNTFLILAQRPDATRVAGYRAWQQLGRQVKKGEHGIQILAPVTRRKVVEDSAPERPTDDRDEETARQVVGYRVAHVFDIDQTTGEALPEPPRAKVLREQGVPEGLTLITLGQINNAGFTVVSITDSELSGLTSFSDRTVTINTTVPPAQMAMVLTHELGHIKLHDPDDPSGLRECRGIREVEAQSFAYLLCESAGLDTSSATFPYIAGWAHSVAGKEPHEVVHDVGQRVLSAATPVIDQLHRPGPFDARRDPRGAVRAAARDKIDDALRPRRELLL